MLLKYHLIDNIAGITSRTIYYRIVSVGTNEKKFYSPIILLQNIPISESMVRLISNPVHSAIEFTYILEDDAEAEFSLFGSSGSRLTTIRNKMRKGITKIKYAFPSGSPSGFYYVHIRINGNLKVFKVQKL